MYKALCGLLLFVLILSLFPALSMKAEATDIQYDRVKNFTQNRNFGRGFSESADVGSLGWSENYLLNWEMDAYETYGDTAHLDRVVDQFDRMMGNAHDSDGDGYLGWDTFRYGYIQTDNPSFTSYNSDVTESDIVVNAGAETADALDVTLPDGWTRENATSSTVLRTVAAATYQEGSAGMALVSDGANPPILRQQLSYTASRYYIVSFYARTDGYGQTDGFVDIYNGTAQSVIVKSPPVIYPSWKKYTMAFRAPASGNLYLRLQQYPTTQSGHKVYYDNVTVVAANDNEAATINKYFVTYGTFETADSSDSTLPNAWQRYNNASSSEVFRSNALNHYYSAADGVSYGVVVKSSNSVEKGLEKAMSPYTSGKEYTVTAFVRTENTAATGRIAVYDATAGQEVGSLSYSQSDPYSVHLWKRVDFTFAAPSVSGHTLYLRLLNDSANEVYYDSVVVKEVIKKSARGWDILDGGNADEYTYVSNRAGDFFSADSGLVVKNNGSTPEGMSQEIGFYEPNSRYAVWFNAKVNASSTVGRVSVYDATAGQELAYQTFSNTEWEINNLQKVIHFSTPADNTHKLIVILTLASPADPSWTAYFDDVNFAIYDTPIVAESNIMTPILRFIQTVDQAEDAVKLKYIDKANEYLPFVENELYAKWNASWVDLDASRGSFIYKSTDQGYVWPGRSYPLNMSVSMIKPSLLLYDITGNAFYLTRAEKLLNTLKSVLSVHPAVPTAYTWNYWNELTAADEGSYWLQAPRAEDTSHANLEITAAVEGFRRGLVFGKQDIEKLMSTLLDVMWNGSTTAPLFGKLVNKQGSDTSDVNSSYSTSLAEWAELAQFDPRFWEFASGVEKAGGALLTFNQAAAINGGFELKNKDDAALPAYWERMSGSASGNVYIDTTDKNSGSQGLTVQTTDASTAFGVKQRIRQFYPNTDYKLSFYGKTDARSTYGKVSVYNETASTELASVTFGGTEWKKYEIGFTTPLNAADTVVIRINNATLATGKTVRVDDLRAYPALADSRTLNAGFEYLVKESATLPRYWTRGANTSETAAYADSANRYRGMNGLTLATNPGAGAQQLYQQWSGYLPQSAYKLTFHAKTNGSGAGGKVRLYNETKGVDIAVKAFTSTSWSEYEVPFTAPVDYNDVVKLYLEHANGSVSGGEAYFDEVAIVRDEPEIRNDVGTGADDGSSGNLPGINLTGSEWGGQTTEDGYTVRYASSSGAGIYVNIVDKSLAYQVKIRYKTAVNGAVRQYTGSSSYTDIGSLIGDNKWHTGTFVLDASLYDHLQSGDKAVNVLLALTSSGIYVSDLWMTPAGDYVYTDVGVAGDSDAELNSPGVSVYANGDWGAPTTVDGYTARSAVKQWPNFYANLFDTSGKYKVAVLYKASTGGYLRQYNGSTYDIIGNIAGDGQWHLDTFALKDEYFDYEGPLSNEAVNVLCEFTMGDITIAGFWLSPAKLVHYTDVGAAGDDSVNNHTPGMSMYVNNEWGVPDIVDGLTVRYAPGASPNVFMNFEDISSNYFIRIKYKTSQSGSYLRKYNGVGFENIGALNGDGQWHTDTFVVTPGYFDYSNAANNAYNQLLDFQKGDIYLSDMWIYK